MNLTPCTQPLRLRVAGFTLVELMVTIAIIGILAAIAMPNFQSMIQANRIQAAAAEFQAGLALARSEAIKRGGDARVTLVANTLASGKANWTSGFKVFYDTTSTASDLGATTIPTNNVLMQTASTNTNVAINSNAPSYVSFNGLGRSILTSGAFQAASFSFGPASGATSADYRCIIMSATGRTRSERIAKASFTTCPTY
jgi:type IV fimbrial biogenesis protein FimT